MSWPLGQTLKRSLALMEWFLIDLGLRECSQYFSGEKILFFDLALILPIATGVLTLSWLSLEQFTPWMLVQFDTRNKTQVIIGTLRSRSYSRAAATDTRSRQVAMATDWSACSVALCSMSIQWSAVWSLQCVKLAAHSLSWRTSFWRTSWKTMLYSETAAFKWQRFTFPVDFLTYVHQVGSFSHCSLGTVVDLHQPSPFPHLLLFIITYVLTPLHLICAAHCVFFFEYTRPFSQECLEHSALFLLIKLHPTGRNCLLCGWLNKWCLHVSSDTNGSFRRSCLFSFLSLPHSSSFVCVGAGGDSSSITARV